VEEKLRMTLTCFVVQDSGCFKLIGAVVVYAVVTYSFHCCSSTNIVIKLDMAYLSRIINSRIAIYCFVIHNYFIVYFPCMINKPFGVENVCCLEQFLDS